MMMNDSDCNGTADRSGLMATNQISPLSYPQLLESHRQNIVYRFYTFWRTSPPTPSDLVFCICSFRRVSTFPQLFFGLSILCQTLTSRQQHEYAILVPLLLFVALRIFGRDSQEPPREQEWTHRRCGCRAGEKWRRREIKFVLVMHHVEGPGGAGQTEQGSFENV